MNACTTTAAGEQDISVKRVIEARRLSASKSPFDQVVGTLGLQGCSSRDSLLYPDEVLGQLMFDYVWNEMNVVSPELAICQVATQRLLGSPVQLHHNDELKDERIATVWQRALYVGSGCRE